MAKYTYLPTYLPLTLNKPAYAAVFILELIKLPMYEFHYIRSKYANKSRSLFTDTNNLEYENETTNVYENLR